MSGRREDSRRSPIPNGTPGRRGRNEEEELVEGFRRISSLSQQDLEIAQEAERDDDFLSARKPLEITDPDTKGDPCPPIPIKMVRGSFRHVLGVREICSKSGAFIHRTIELRRKPGEPLGFYIRQGDGWERDQGIFVSRVTLGTDVDVFELLRVGDEIVKVNKVNIQGMSVEDVSALMHMTKRLIITVKVWTPLSKKKLSKSNLSAGSSSSKFSKSSKGESLQSLAVSGSAQDRKLSIHGRPSHQTNYKIANMIIGKSKDAITQPSSDAASSTSSETSSSSSQSRTKRSLKSPSSARRILSPIRESASDITSPYNSDSDLLDSPRSSRRSSRAASVVSWYDQRIVENTPPNSRSRKPSRAT